jgi:3-isopropylmalate/(R)-2-methylmalate dehydratase small subunit
MLFRKFAAPGTAVRTDLDKCVFHFENGRRTETIRFTLSDFDRKLVSAGGWLEYADRNY